MRNSKADLAAAQATVESWKGPHRDVFDSKVTTYGSSAESVAAALEALAEGIAAAETGRLSAGMRARRRLSSG